MSFSSWTFVSLSFVWSSSNFSSVQESRLTYTCRGADQGSSNTGRLCTSEYVGSCAMMLCTMWIYQTNFVSIPKSSVKSIQPIQSKRGAILLFCCMNRLVITLIDTRWPRSSFQSFFATRITTITHVFHLNFQVYNNYDLYKGRLPNSKPLQTPQLNQGEVLILP